MRTGDSFDPDDLERRIDQAIESEAAALLDVRGPRTVAARVRAALESQTHGRRPRPVRLLAPIGAVCMLILGVVIWQVRTPEPRGTRPDLVARAGTEAARPPAAVTAPNVEAAVAPAPARAPRPPVRAAEPGQEEDIAAGAVEALAMGRVEVPAVLVEPLSVERLQVPLVSVERIGGRDGPGISSR